MAEIDALVVGAGVVGLAIARALTEAGLRTILADGEKAFGSWTSSRNSEVIHAGVYYPRGSLKALLCTRGRARLYAYCARRGVPHRRIGKIIFAATADQSLALDAIMSAAADAEVDDLIRMDGRESKAIEPALDCHEALLSPSTGIIDSHGLMSALLTDVEESGGIFARSTLVNALTPAAGGGWNIWIEGETAAAATARIVVNAGGLAAHRLAAKIEGLAPCLIPKVRFARGVYFTYTGRIPFGRLIYPTPVPGGLGTHLTLDMAGTARFGPDVEWIDDIDYTVDPARKEGFLAAARLIWPGIDAERLTPGYAGIRPKLSGPGEPAADFRIDGPERHGLAGLVNLFGIESPGLTSSLAIADEVVRKLGIAAPPA